MSTDVELNESAHRVLIVDDEAGSRQGLSELARNWGYETETAADGAEGLEKAESFRPQVVIADLVMPRLDGLGLLSGLRTEGHRLAVVMLTAKGSIATAVEAMKMGAFDYLTKPVDTQQLRIAIQNALERSEAYKEIERYQRQLESDGQFGSLVGTSPIMRELYDLMGQVGPTAASVLIVGESGTGKELVARTLHDLSARRSSRFVPVNCAAIPETLLESELFGHERGAFTGANGMRRGLFELADGGSLLLDEVAEMAPATQAKLLRVLEERAFRRLGGSDEIRVDVRVFAATNRSPEEALEQGKLREDLYYRLNVFTLELPPLRRRVEDVEQLVASFVKDFNETNRKKVARASDEVLGVLRNYRWPGNVRELRNVIERAVIVAKGEQLTLKDLPANVFERGEGREKSRQSKGDASTRRSDGTGEDGVEIPVGTTVEEAEKALILKTLESTGQNKTRAAEMLGISLKTLHNKLKKYQKGAPRR